MKSPDLCWYPARTNKQEEGRRKKEERGEEIRGRRGEDYLLLL